MVVGVVRPEVMGATLWKLSFFSSFFSARLGYLAVRYLSLFLFVVKTTKDSHETTTGRKV